MVLAGEQHVFAMRTEPLCPSQTLCWFPLSVPANRVQTIAFLSSQKQLSGPNLVFDDFFFQSILKLIEFLVLVKIYKIGVYT